MYTLLMNIQLLNCIGSMGMAIESKISQLYKPLGKKVLRLNSNFLPVCQAKR